MIEANSVFTYHGLTDSQVEQYNICLSMTHLMDETDIVHAFDNEALFNICFRHLKLKTPIFADMNYLIAHQMSGISST